MSCLECDKPIHARGLCHTHYARIQRSSDFVPRDRTSRVCELCDNPSRSLGLCNTHYMQAYRKENPTRIRARMSNRVVRSPKSTVVKVKAAREFKPYYTPANVDVDDMWEWIKKEMANESK